MTTEQQRKMLEAAAKACGLSVKPMEIKNVTAQGDDRFIGLLADEWPRGWFNPLANPLDTAEMCAKLEISTVWMQGFVKCNKWLGADAKVGHNSSTASKEAAWRLAASIVAAKVGGYSE